MIIPDIDISYVELIRILVMIVERLPHPVWYFDRDWNTCSMRYHHLFCLANQNYCNLWKHSLIQYHDYDWIIYMKITGILKNLEKNNGKL